MLAHYGYTDGSGDYYITLDTDKCNACGECVTVCPQGIFELWEDDYGDTVAKVRDDKVRQIGFHCTVCKPEGAEHDLKCVKACKPMAIVHSW